MDDSERLIEQLRKEIESSKGQVARSMEQERVLCRTRGALKAVRECQKVLLNSKDERMLLKETCRVIVQSAGYRFAWVGYAQDNAIRAVIPEAQFGYENGYLASIRISWEDDPTGYGPTGTAIRTGKPSICRDILTDPQYEPWRQEASKRGFASSIALPLVGDKAVYGALNIYAAEPNAFDEDETNLLMHMAEMLSFGINELRMRTEIARINEQNTKNATLLDLIFKHTLDSIVLLDRDFKFLRVSHTYARVCQRDIAEFIGRNHFEIYPSDFRDEAEAAKAGKYVYSRTERPFVFPDHPEWGTTYWDLGLVPILDDTNEIEFFLFTLKDVTLQRRYKDELMTLNAELHKIIQDEVEKNRRNDQIMYEQSRHIAMGELLFNIAHQWRQPLCSIGLMVQDIEDAYRFKALDAAYIENSSKAIMKELLYLSNTIDEFKVFYAGNNEKTRFNLSETVHRVLSVMTDYFRSRKVAVEVDIDNRINMDGYVNEFSQVFLNILTNIRDVFERRQVANAVVKIVSYRQPQTGKVILTLTDNGGGIDNNIIGRIFDPYFTTKDKSRGTGLGLYIARVIIENNMHGTITATNTADGCLFRIEM
ncbi:MAG: GAF domain-containing protein [Candidatus Magnetobacterium sp. LHC-1]|nr:GAF domain-containing protein [Nitrospirota bacterium]